MILIKGMYGMCDNHVKDYRSHAENEIRMVEHYETFKR